MEHSRKRAGAWMADANSRLPPGLRRAGRFDRPSLNVRTGARLAALRIGADLTKASVSAATGIAEDRIREIEAGIVRAESGELYDIAICLNASISDILAGL